MAEREHINDIERLTSKVEALSLRKQKLETRLNREKAKLKQQVQKARNRRLLALGTMMEQAGLSEFDDGALMGALQEMKLLLTDAPTYKMLVERGQCVAEQQEHEGETA